MKFILRKRVPKHRVIKPIISDGINKYFQMDLINLQKYAKSNFGYRYCLNIIDIFSKFLYSIPIKNKSAESISIELNKLFSNPNNRPNKLQSDNGLEFKNDLVKNICKKYGINQVFSFQYTPEQNGCIEQCNKTLKNKIFNYFLIHNTNQYIDILPQLVSNYNSNIHSTTKNKPSEIKTNPYQLNNLVKQNITKVAQNLLNHKLPTFKKNNSVQIAICSTDEYK
jgi:transposase InsO family protein